MNHVDGRGIDLQADIGISHRAFNVGDVIGRPGRHRKRFCAVVACRRLRRQFVERRRAAAGAMRDERGRSEPDGGGSCGSCDDGGCCRHRR